MRRAPAWTQRGAVKGLTPPAVAPLGGGPASVAPAWQRSLRPLTPRTHAHTDTHKSKELDRGIVFGEGKVVGSRASGGVRRGRRRQRLANDAILSLALAEPSPPATIHSWYVCVILYVCVWVGTAASVVMTVVVVVRVRV